MRIVLLLALAGCATQEMSDWERANIDARPVEEHLVLPPYPQPGRLLPFGVADSGGFRFFVDGATLSVGKDRIVRYVLVARSPDGAQNVTYEGIRCSSGEYRIYALGRADGTWSEARGGWRAVAGAPARQVALFREYFCPQAEPIRTAAEGVRALEQGGHPFSKGFGGTFGAGR
ncbi:MAG TPA: CNP1-like family protein [Burkholderiales bacterium]|nr:CNP1-like family protein [Burkholderiales bacterium]